MEASNQSIAGDNLVQSDVLHYHLLWRFDVSSYPVILNSACDSLSLASNECTVNSHGIIIDNIYGQSIKINSAAKVAAIFADLYSKVGADALHLHKWDAISKAVENQLMFMLLRSLQGHSFNIVEIYLDEAYTYTWCSPSIVGRNMPLRSFLNSNQSMRKNPRFYALLLLQAFAEIFHNSLIEDVASTICHGGTSHSKNISEEVPTMKIYQCIDNVHINEIQTVPCSNDGAAGNSSVSLEPLHINGLRPKLRPYQEAAVRWMIEREKIDANSQRHSNEWEIAWIVISSRNNLYDQLGSSSTISLVASITPLYEWMKDTNSTDKGILFYSPFGGWLARSYKEAKDFTLNLSGGSNSNPTASGGILADSMGLGKTVETLALILANRCPSADTGDNLLELKKPSSDTVDKNDSHHLSPAYLDTVTDNTFRCFCGRGKDKDSSSVWVWCQGCHEPMHFKCADFNSLEEAMASCILVTQDGFQKLTCNNNRCPLCHKMVVRSRATLIITPPAILAQWQREISRHVDDREFKNNVAIYRGVKAIVDGPKDCADRRYLHPAKLADHDIVLCTFDTLMTDLSHSHHNPFVQPLEGATTLPKKSLRWKKRYVVIPSPLIRIRWFRVVLDEAQRVEAPTVMSAKMALQLQAEHRWCVTGTPVSRGRLDDLFGLLLFLRLIPFDEKSWYINCLRYCHRSFLDRLGHLLYNAVWRSTIANNVIRVQLGLPEQEEVLKILTFSSIERHFYERQLQSTVIAASGLEKQRKKRSLSNEFHGVSNELRRLRAACCHPQVGSFGIEAARDKVLSMNQILSLLIGEARTNAEEAQRLTILHIIALANLNRLKGEVESERSFFSKSYGLYVDALKIADKYCSPSLCTDETLSAYGSVGFRGIHVNEGVIALNWTHTEYSLDTDGSRNCAVDQNPIWCLFEFKTVQRISGVLIRSLTTHQNETGFSELQPKDLILEAVINGMNVECMNFSMNQSEASEWTQHDCLMRTLKAKNLRLRVLSFHDDDVKKPKSFVTGLEIKLMEMDISIDDLQRLHILHNVSDLLSCYPEAAGDDRGQSHSTLSTEARHVEARYLQSAIAAHAAAKLQLSAKTHRRVELGAKVASKSRQFTWWELILSSFRHNEARVRGDKLFEFIKDRLDEFHSYSSEARMRFPDFKNLDGVYIALVSRIRNSVPVLYDHHEPDCILALSRLSSAPSQEEINENSTCHSCRKDWGQIGPTCRHCKLETIINEYHEGLHDTELSCMIRSIYDWSRTHLDLEVITQSLLEEAEFFFEYHSSLQKELEAAKLMWRAHFNLLSDIDEVSMCKRRQLLKTEGHELSTTDAVLVVCKNEIDYLIDDHFSKQAMTEAQLRRKLDTVRYLKSLRQSSGDSEDTCPICLNKFDGERAVLLCGHGFHPIPCLEALLNRSGGSGISCPMRCTQRTQRGEVLVATSKRSDDGSPLDQRIEGCWGTKVDRLVVDLKNLNDRGIVKSIIFSQWDDMLDVVEEALKANDVSYIRPLSKKTFGFEINRFQTSSSSYALLMNVKQGAEGLNLTEATYVFILEPLLSSALDRQALSRVHRIGQRNKTFVYRYLIKDTVEVKIDRFRRMHESVDLEDPFDGHSNNIVNAGGLDGGFELSELHELLSQE